MILRALKPFLLSLLLNLADGTSLAEDLLPSSGEANALSPQLPTLSVQGGSRRYDHFTKIAISPDGTLVADENSEGLVTLRDATTGASLRQWRIAPAPANAMNMTSDRDIDWLCFPGDRETLAIKHRDASLSLWSTATGKAIESPLAKADSTMQCAAGIGLYEEKYDEQAGPIVLTSYQRGVAHTQTLSVKRGPLDEPTCIVPVPGGRYIAYMEVAGENRSQALSYRHFIVHILDASTGKELWRFHPIPFWLFDEHSIALNPTADALAYISNGGAMHPNQVVLVHRNERVASKPMHFELPDVEWVAFVNGGRWLMLSNYGRIDFNDLTKEHAVHSLRNLAIAAVLPETARSILVRGSACETCLIDLPSLRRHWGTAAQIEAIEQMIAVQGRLLVSTHSRIAEIPAAGTTHGMALRAINAVADSDMTFDPSTDRLVVPIGVAKERGMKEQFLNYALRLPTGEQFPLIFPNKERADYFVFPAGEDLLATTHSMADWRRAAAAHFGDIDGLETRFYRVNDRGAVTFVGKRPASATDHVLSADGSVLWLLENGKTLAVDTHSLAELTIMPNEKPDFAKSWTLERNNEVFSVGNSSLRRRQKEGGPKITVIPAKSHVAENFERYWLTDNKENFVADVETGSRRRLDERCPVPIGFSADGSLLACAVTVGKLTNPLRSSGMIERIALIEMEGGGAIKATFDQFVEQQSQLTVPPIFSPDGRQVFYWREYSLNGTQNPDAITCCQLATLNVDTGESVTIPTKLRAPPTRWPHYLGASADGSVIAVVTAYDQRLEVFERAGDAITKRFEESIEGMTDAVAVDVSPDGRLIAIGHSAVYRGGSVYIYSAVDGSLLRRTAEGGGGDIRFGGDGNAVFSVTQVGLDAFVHDVSNGTLICDYHGTGGFEVKRAGVVSMGNKTRLHVFAPDSRHCDNEVLFTDDASFKSLANPLQQLTPDVIALLRVDGAITLMSISQRAAIARIYMMPSGNWVVVAPDGHFDAASLEDLSALGWVLPDDPYRSVPFEAFMKEFYEPQLLPRLLSGAKLDASRPLASLNRVQPEVRIVSATADPKDANRVLIDVEARGAMRNVLRGRIETPMSTGVHDLRVFRDGQLVGFTDGELAAYGARPYRRQFSVRLPMRTDVKSVELSAYAFNDDGVKSTTTRETYSVPVGKTAEAGRAYVVTIGVNRYTDPSSDLRYAANDARLMSRTLESGIKKAGQYRDVIPISLISDEGEDTASSAVIKGVLDRLAGKPVAEEVLAHVEHANDLRTANPNDLVMLTFSGHGYAEPAGGFTLITQDAAMSSDVAADGNVITGGVSSDDLSRWLRNVDAGNLVLVVDACHSAASVDGSSGFKPGPMGSRGLGQLSFDKGMRVLAASQADGYALELDSLQHGLLSFALITDGLDDFSADRAPKDGKITLDEWLNYGVDQVPALAEEVSSGRVPRAIRGLTRISIVAAAEKLRIRAAQQPVLFDFSKHFTPVFLAVKEQVATKSAH